MNIILAILLAILPPCASDGPEPGACAWNAATQGNGQGSSYVQIMGVIVR